MCFLQTCENCSSISLLCEVAVCVEDVHGGCRGFGGVMCKWYLGPLLTETHRYSSSSCIAFCFQEGRGGGRECGGRLDGWMACWDTVPPDFPKNPPPSHPLPPPFQPPHPSQCSATVLSAAGRLLVACLLSCCAECLTKALFCRQS